MVFSSGVNDFITPESQSFEVEARALELVKNGELTEGLLQAAIATWNKRNKGRTNEFSNLSGLCNI